MEGFSPIKAYIFGIYSSTQLSNHRSHDGQSCLKERLDINLFWKETSETAISGQGKVQKTAKKKFF